MSEPHSVASSDPLFSAAMYFVAARPFTGPGALIRRFKIGKYRALELLVLLERKGLLRGHWGSRMYCARFPWGVVYVHSRYRVLPHAWPAVMAQGPV